MAASGLPVLASRLQGLQEAVVDGTTGYHFEPGNSPELARMIGRLLDEPDEVQELGAAGRERCVQELSTHKQQERFVQVIRARSDFR